MIRLIKKIRHSLIDSTAAWTKSFFKKISPDTIFAISASEQSAGKGTAAKYWHSPKDVNLYLTMAFSIKKDFPYLANISQLLSLTLAEFLVEVGFTPKCKWPNDILINGKKIAGVLTEVTSGIDGSLVFASLGLNINMPKTDLECIDQPATSLFIETDKVWDVDKIEEALLEAFNINLNELENEGFGAFKERYSAFLLYKGEFVALKKDHRIYQGTFIGVDSEGRLLLKTESETHILTSSDRLLKIYGTPSIFRALKMKDPE